MNQTPRADSRLLLSLDSDGGRRPGGLSRDEDLTVDVHQWLTFTQLVHLYSMGQIAPGPNMMMIVSIGEWAAGIPGAIVVLIAFFGPTALLASSCGRLWKRLEKWPWRNFDSSAGFRRSRSGCCWRDASALREAQ